MPNFDYKSVGRDGVVSSGTLVASSQREAIDYIRAKGAIPISAEIQNQGVASRLKTAFSGSSKGKKLGAKFENFALQMSSLLSAGINVDECLQIIQKTTADELTTYFAAGIESGIREGHSLTTAADKTSIELPKVALNILRTAEARGDLADGFKSLTAHLQRERENSERLKSALLYPIILTAVSALSLIAIFTFVIPQFSQLFADMGDSLPFLTRFVLGVADALGRWGWAILLAILGAAYFIRGVFADEERRAPIDAKILSLGSIGNLVLLFQSERYFRSLGALLRSGMTLSRAMSVAAGSLTNLHLIDAANSAEQMVAEGTAISNSLEHSGVWPPLAIQLLRVGERIGDLASMTQRAAETFESDVKIATDKMLSILEPLLVVVLGFVIAVIIIAVLMGIMSVNDLPI